MARRPSAAAYTVASAITVALARRASALSGQDGTVLVLNDMQLLVYEIGAAFLAMYLVGFSLAGQRTRTMPAWLCWLGYVSAGVVLIGVVGAAAPGSIDIAFFAASLGFLVWTLISGVRLLRSAQQAAPASVARPA